MTKGMVIKESLVEGATLDTSIFKIVERYPLLMDGAVPVEIIMVEVQDAMLLSAMSLISRILRPKKFYAHFVAGDLMYVVFPQTITVVERGSHAGEVATLNAAQLLGIPSSQLPFNRMFSFGHAESD